MDRPTLGGQFESAAERAARDAQNLDVMSALADADLPRLHNKFNRNGGFLTESEFVKNMIAYCPAIAQIYNDAGCSPNPVRTVFYNIDADSDGKVFWDDLYSFAVDTARQRMQTLPADRIRKYSHTRSFPREDNVTRMRYLRHLDVISISSRHAPLQIAEPRTLQTLFEFTASDLGGHDVLPLCVENLPSVNGVVVFCSDMKLRCWMLTDKLPAYRPFMVDHAITQLRASNYISPSVILASDRQGQVTFLDYSRSLGEPSVRDVIKLHDPQAGGITDFCFCQSQEAKLVTAGYDGTLQLVDTATRKAFAIGANLSSTVLRVAFLDSHQSIICASGDNTVSSWPTHNTQKPSTIFSDPSRPHLGRIISVDTVPNTPQVISCDNRGLMKVWDIRTFTCVQSLRNGEGVGGESGDVGNDFSHGNVSSSVYVESTREIACADPSSLTFHEYDKGTDPTLADQQNSIAVRHNAAVNSVVTMTATSISIWSLADGFVSTQFESSKGRDLSCFCFDGKGRRIFIGALDGHAYSIAYHGGSVLDEFKLHSREIVGIEYSDDHRSLVTASADGYVSVRKEASDSLNPPTSRLHVGGPVAAMVIQPKLGLIACGTSSGSLVVIDLAHPRTPESEHKTCGPIRSICFIDSFPLIATGHTRGDISLTTCRPVLNPQCILQFNVKDVNEEIMSKHVVDAVTSNMGFRRRSFNPVANAIGVTDFSFSVEITQLRFHPQRHELIICDSSGRVTVVSLCNVLQAYKLTLCSYPSTKPFSLMDRRRGSDSSAPTASSSPAILPRFVSAARAHQDEVLDVEVVPHLDMFITAGEDRRVRLWTMGCEGISELSAGRLPDEKSLQRRAAEQSLSAPKRRGLAHHFKIAAMAAAKPPPKIAPYSLPEDVTMRLTECLAGTPSRGYQQVSLSIQCDHILPEELEKISEDTDFPEPLSSPSSPTSPGSTFAQIVQRRKQSIQMLSRGDSFRGNQSSNGANISTTSSGVFLSTDEAGSLNGASAEVAAVAGGPKPPSYRAKLNPDRYSASRAGNAKHLQPLLRKSFSAASEAISDQGTQSNLEGHSFPKESLQQVPGAEVLATLATRDDNDVDPGEEQVDWAQQTAPEVDAPPPSGEKIVTSETIASLGEKPVLSNRPQTILYDTPAVVPVTDFLSKLDSSIRRVKDLQAAHQHWERLSSARSSRPATARTGVSIAECSVAGGGTQQLTQRPATGDSFNSDHPRLRLGGHPEAICSPRSLSARPSTALVPVQATSAQEPCASPRSVAQLAKAAGAGTSRVGIHVSASPRVTSANMYVSRVRHDAPGFGRTAAPVRPVRPDARMQRINLFEEELRRCLLRPKPEIDSEINSVQWKCS
jgi:WD40 repeat protein